MLRCSLSSAKIQKKSKQQFHLIPFFYFPPKDCPSEGAATPTRLCRLPEQELQQPSKQYYPTECTNASSGGHLSPLGFAACQSKKCTNKAVHAPTLQSSHGTRRTHRTFWQIRLSHRLHRFSQMFRVVCCSVGVLSGGAAVSAAPTKQTCTNITILPQIAQNPPWLAANILPQIARICTD